MLTASLTRFVALDLLFGFLPTQEVELQLARETDEREFNLVTGSRVFVHVPPSCMMGFNQSDVDSTPLV